ncbi:conserved hypothetical protein [Candidatus Magnetomoraceae bacterium gMMP-15]
MAKIIPFKGLTYSSDKCHIADVVTPPYDVISEQELNFFYNRHPQNIIRLILGKRNQNDDESNNCYTRAAQYYEKWQAEKFIVQDKKPAFYFTEMDFNLNGKKITRCGLIALIKLETFDKGVIRPHEKTFSNVKSERFQLMIKTHANFSPIFSLFPDSQNTILNALKNGSENIEPDMSFEDSYAQYHRVWRLTDPDLHQYVGDAMKEKSIFIADGHHRYETALNYLAWRESKDPNLPQDHPCRYIMMYLTSMEDSGLVILPAHRKVTHINENILTSFEQKAGKFFDVERFPFNSDNKEKVQAEFLKNLHSLDDKHAIGVVIKNQDHFYLFKLKPNIMDSMDEIEYYLKDLDVTLVTRVVFEKILSFGQTELDNEQLITYSSSIDQAIKDVENGISHAAFLLNPTKIEQVQKIAEAGLVMPRKSTYFYPKVITGLVINKL